MIKFISFFFIFVITLSNAQSKTQYVSENANNEELAYALGTTLEESIQNDEPQQFLKQWHTDSFKEQIRKEMKLEEVTPYYKGFLEGVTKGLSGFPNKLIAEYNADAYYDFIGLRYEKLEQTYYALFRFYSESEGINYHDYKLCLVDGKFMFSDVYIYLTGEHFSATVGRLGILALPKNKLAEVFGMDSSRKDYGFLQDAIKLAKKGSFEKAYKSLLKVKGDLKDDKFFLLLKSQYAMSFDMDAYNASIEDLMETFPYDSTLNILYIDYYTALEKYEKAMGYIDQLEEETKDDFLRLMKAHLYYTMDNTEKAMENYEFIIENYAFFEAYSAKLTLLTHSEQFDDAIELLDELAQDYEKSDLIEYIEEKDENGENILEALVKSKAYKTWKKSK
ncbi:hypothetical protein RM697_03480 [Ichthyenterobacterium sp. W332]|uniref:Tetratricopeptide repeat protein n=1 Tax=Microcosmobacter mediterraneus TaxID=3075607 RepID=A0ABU2YHP9_9FLAO|nr:hypothetical protein [Ichthyenterobacterium sp. W332]MDT0557691.1 hypothetical protein [Ichthyenterobacterium sp. W332]